MVWDSNRKLSYYSLAVLAACVVAFSGTLVALAAPPGVPHGSKLVYKFNLIGYPAGHEYTGGCGQGHRIFVNRDAHHAQILVTDENDGWRIADCNATADNRAVLHTDRLDIYDVYVRILGKPGGHLFICADTYEDWQTGEHLCLLGTIDLTRGKGQSKFQLKPASIFDASVEDIMWTVDTNAHYRIAQFRVYTRP